MANDLGWIGTITGDMTMPGYWVVRSNREVPEFFWSELVAGRLRQGWGWQEDQNLKLLRKKRDHGEDLSEKQLLSWRGNRRLLDSEEDGVRTGDIIISPHLPEYGVWSISLVTGPYRFEIHPERRDYGHILPVELLTTKNRPVDPYEEAVPALLRETMRNRSRMWNIDHLKGEVDQILAALKSGAPRKNIELGSRIRDILASIEDASWKRFAHHFHGAEFEHPCLLLLEKLYGKEHVEHRGGRAERGADAICHLRDPLGVQHSVAVQIKMWTWDAHWTRPLRQIEEAYNSYEGITSGVILTTSMATSEKFEEERRALEQKLRIPIQVILRRELLQLFMRHLPELGLDEE